MPEGRRTFLRTVAGAGLACAGCSSSSAEPQAFGDVNAGNVSDVPVGTLRAVTGAPALIGRDAGGLYAMTTTCTHEACNLGTRGQISSAGIACSCHGSEFDRNGAIVKGPADSPLQHFAVSLDAQGVVTVHGGRRVDAAVRTPVP